MNPKISVIMPMYNVEKYVGCAIQSLLDQTFADFELILIDDGSTDKTLDEAKKFTDPRIKIFKNKRNLGVGLTRNYGISLTQGEYIYFCDSDDAVFPNALQSLLEAAEKNKSDLVTSTIYLRANDSEFQTIKDIKCNAVSAGVMGRVAEDIKSRIWEEYALHKTHCSVCFSLYKKGLFSSVGGGYKKLYFREFPVAEDDFFLFELLCLTSNVVKIEVPFYIYRVKEGSISNSSDINRLKKYIPTFMEFAKLINKKLITLTQDQYFSDSVVSVVLGRLMNLFVIPMLLKDREGTFKNLTEILKPIFRENCSFVKTMICSAMYGEIMSSRLSEENRILKTKIQNI